MYALEIAFLPGEFPQDKIPAVNKNIVEFQSSKYSTSLASCSAIHQQRYVGYNPLLDSVLGLRILPNEAQPRHDRETSGN